MFDGVGAEITTIPENTQKIAEAQKGSSGGVVVIGILALLYGLSFLL